MSFKLSIKISANAKAEITEFLKKNDYKYMTCIYCRFIDNNKLIPSIGFRLFDERYKYKKLGKIVIIDDIECIIDVDENNIDLIQNKTIVFICDDFDFY